MLVIFLNFVNKKFSYWFKINLHPSQSKTKGPTEQFLFLNIFLKTIIYPEMHHIMNSDMNPP